MLEKSTKVSHNYIADCPVEGVQIVKATVEHAGYLQHRLRPSDARECLIAGVSTWKALHEPLRDKYGNTWTILINGEPCAMFGTSDMTDREDLLCGCIWLLGSHLCEEKPVAFCKATKYIMDSLLLDYDILENLVPVDHERTIKWLTWLGFSFAKKLTIINGFQCVRFVRCNSRLDVAWS